MGERDFLTPPSCLNHLGVIIPTRDWLFSTLFVIQLCFTFGKKTAIWNCFSHRLEIKRVFEPGRVTGNNIEVILCITIVCN